MIQISTNDDSLILDFFSGSGTTAHAVMEFNKERESNRKFILIQLPELCEKGTTAEKLGYMSISDIGKERIRKVGEIINTGITHNDSYLDTGFRVFKLDDSNMTDVFYSVDNYSQDLLSHLESNIKTNRNDLDLLFGCLLEWGLPLSLPYNSENVEGYTVHNYNSGDLIACFDKAIPDSVIKYIAKQQPLRAVFRDNSFADSPSKINVGEIFKSLAPDTRVKVI